MKKYKQFVAGTILGLAVLVMPAAALAHVSATPNEVGTSKMQTFTIGIPNEKTSPTVSVRIALAEDLAEVTPTVKAGWQVKKESGQGEGATQTLLTWSGGSIPAGQRDDFSFSAHTPVKATTLHWSVYQTYQDGSMTSWNQPPSKSEDASGNSGPFITVKVVSDPATAGSGTVPAPTAAKSSSSTASANNTSVIGAYVLSGIGLAVSIVVFAKTRKPNTPQ